MVEEVAGEEVEARVDLAAEVAEAEEAVGEVVEEASVAAAESLLFR